jgi:hypothetical protein
MNDRQEGTVMHGLIRQGDVLVVPCNTVPKTRKPVARENGRLILAHGEATGHAHAIIDEHAELVTAGQANELYLLVHGRDPVALVHDEHDTLTITPGTYRVVRQREYSPEGLRNVAD